MNIDDILNKIDPTNLTIAFGKITNISAITLTGTGLEVAVGDIVRIESVQKIYTVLGMVTTIDGAFFTIVPFSFIDGFKINDKIFLQRDGLTVKCGYGLLGRVVNALGEPIDDKGKIRDIEGYTSINKLSMPPLERGIIDKKFATGVKPIDAMLTCGKGQKVGIFAGSGVGKSTLMGMIVKGCEAQIKVVALIGERGREIPEFIHYNLGGNLDNTVLVTATSDESALMRKYGAFTAMSIAEYFRDKGHDVLLMMDSVTRFAMAQREIGLSTGEPPVSRGYPPSVFALLPQLMERAGNNQLGSITAFFTVLVDGDDLNDPIADQSRSILDGHIVLTRDLTEQGFYPPVNILKSASRVMDKVVTKDQYNDFLKLKRVLSLIKENEVLVRVGAYKPGMDLELDAAMSKKEKIREFLTQDSQEVVPYEDMLTRFKKALE
ncbi:flagellar protein export ATPase FliI [Aliarcobacter cibarius]|jgi:flagellum-specific ATP synthase|uniref:Flagellar export apparatus, cytoplasmic ATPase complex, FliI component n=1 Tax=Aliarcobacter cibarius TaxID=255507 RepID=A0A5J6RFE3_9BACT|nr:flagellar protein export ATPase FliI [Aliarcobacter cibarius]QEZ88564.1 flagellar export apparatus, cytoplasmic ATPase complex, FliI component [Aliarcobacter cibarius]QKJ26603.1 flagellar export apparatus, cytoplasmic ATPase complex, FliI component [Aliarcobacter cibarius]TLS98958.1 flagellar protein export ATPase FliI [Aliarcobacter cibarius]TLS99874.1 flagellar protein export ATPase FliI [Aliarcobacter cibarius]TLT03781.1 flagellar protein export ATPase FliI [Aliarcobacter cibarius]